VAREPTVAAGDYSSGGTVATATATSVGNGSSHGGTTGTEDQSHAGTRRRRQERTVASPVPDLPAVPTHGNSCVGGVAGRATAK